MSNSIIIANGEIKDYDKTRLIIEGLINTDSQIIIADGGSNHLDRLNIKPDYIVGDLDSSDSYDRLRQKYPECKFELFDSEKDYTDLELAIDLAISMSSSCIYLLGCLGKRLDHTLGNLFLLKKIKNRASRGIILDETNRVEYIKNESLILEIDEYKYFSFIPVEGDVKSISLKGMKYPLYNKYVEFGSTLGISNEIIEEEASVEIKDSSALMIRSSD